MEHDPASTRPADATAAAETSSPTAASVTSEAPRDMNSRIERRLWLLRKGADRAEGRSGIKFGRREFRVYVNGGLLWSRNYALDESAPFDADAASRFAEFVALGWEVPADTPGAR